METNNTTEEEKPLDLDRVLRVRARDVSPAFFEETDKLLLKDMMDNLQKKLKEIEDDNWKYEKVSLPN